MAEKPKWNAFKTSHKLCIQTASNVSLSFLSSLKILVSHSVCFPTIMKSGLKVQEIWKVITILSFECLMVFFFFSFGFWRIATIERSRNLILKILNEWKNSGASQLFVRAKPRSLLHTHFIFLCLRFNCF